MAVVSFKVVSRRSTPLDNTNEFDEDRAGTVPAEVFEGIANPGAPSGRV